jgi:RND family efflux transporter MFP subunit
MKFKYSMALISPLLLVGLSLTVWCMATRVSAVEPTTTMDTEAAVPPLITTAYPVTRTFILHVPWIGAVEPTAFVELTTLTAGRIESVMVEDQTRVVKGEPVARLGGSQVEWQRAGLAAEIESLKSQLDLAQQTVGRLKSRLKEQLSTYNQVAAAQETQVKLEAQLREARLNAETFEHQVLIRAPISGIFTNRNVSVGQDVDAGRSFGEILDPDHLKIAAFLFPPQGVEIQGREATVRLEENHNLTGVVRRVLPRAGITGAAMVWIEGPQIDRHLRPGQSVGGSILVEVKPGALAVPESAIVYDSDEHPYLFTKKEGVYEPQSVQLGLTEAGWVEVLSGLEPGESVVIKGAYELFYRGFNRQFKVQD